MTTSKDTIRIEFSGVADISLDALAENLGEVTISEGVKKQLICYALIHSPAETLARATNISVSNKVFSKYYYSLEKYAKARNCSVDEIYQKYWGSMNDWMIRFDKRPVFPCKDSNGDAFMLIDDGVVYYFNPEWCEEI